MRQPPLCIPGKDGGTELRGSHHTGKPMQARLRGSGRQGRDRQPAREMISPYMVANQGSEPMACDTFKPRVERTLPTGWSSGKHCAMQSWFLALLSSWVTWARD